MSYVTSVSEPAAEAAAPERSGRWSRVVLGLAAIELVVLFAPTAQWLYERWTLSVWHNVHGMFVPPLVAYFVYDELKQHGRRPAASSAWGFAFLVPALLLHALDAGMHTQLLSAFALVLALPGLALLLLGVERTRTIAFPLAFTVFALPIPLGFTEPIHLLLRQIATVATSTVLPWMGVWVVREGTTLHLASGSLEVSTPAAVFPRFMRRWPSPF